MLLSWVPLIGGSAGAILGGVISDRLAIRWGKMTRPCVLIFSQVSKLFYALRIYVSLLTQLLAIPFLVGVLHLYPSLGISHAASGLPNRRDVDWSVLCYCVRSSTTWTGV